MMEKIINGMEGILEQVSQEWTSLILGDLEKKMTDNRNNLKLIKKGKALWGINV